MRALWLCWLRERVRSRSARSPNRTLRAFTPGAISRGGDCRLAKCPGGGSRSVADSPLPERPENCHSQSRSIRVAHRRRFTSNRPGQGTDDGNGVPRTAAFGSGQKRPDRSVEERLVALGLRNDLREDAPICRWLTPEDVQVDVMPVDQAILGFSNQWYPTAVERAVDYLLTDDAVIRIPTAPVFLATKWEAFLGRGEGDLLGSHDLEDIITVVAGRSEVLEELDGEPVELR